MIVFAGPSIVGAAIPDGIELRPPAKQGDIYLATLESPEPIGLIDGYFEGVPAVWHKEILWALAHDIPVLGASSMGALRAAEMDHYGMIGVGAIYEAYRDGVYEDDDEVALHHAPPQLDYTPLSIAMVNIRATIDAAVGQKIITVKQGARVVTIAKARYYGDRVWKQILKEASASVRKALTDWLPDNQIDQKQVDAAALLDRMVRGDVRTPSVPHVESFRFEHTHLWDTATELWQKAKKTQEPAPSGLRLLDGDQTLD